MVLGGCADMATPLLRLLRQDEEVRTVTLADINLCKAEALAAECGPRFSPVRCDATDHGQVTSLIKDHDVVLCYVGPFYRFEKTLAAYAIEAGVHYVSIADDYDAYLDVITLEEAARAAGVKILTGFGNSPGLTQILARKGYNEVTDPFRISVNWCAGSNEQVGPSNLMHLFHIFNGTTLQWMGGKEVRVKTGGGGKRVQFPEPVGAARVYYTGHAESVSLPRNLSGLDEVTLHGGVKPEYIVRLIRLMSLLRMLSSHSKRAALARFFHRFEKWFSSPGLDQSVGRVEIWGRENGRTVQKAFTYAGHIADITSLPAYLAAKWLWLGKFDSKPGGVYAAERLLDHPDAFIEQLRALGLKMWP